MANPKQKITIVVSAKNIKAVQAQMRALGGTTGKTTKGMGMMVGAMATATIAFYAMSRAVKAVMGTYAEFQQGMANVKAISGATGVQFLKLEDSAKKLGRSTKFTATQVSELQTEYAKLGFSTKEILKAQSATLALASAVGAELATSAEVAGNTLRGFGLEADETSRVTDVMALSFSRSALDMNKFSDSMKYVAPVAKMAGVSLEGTTAIMGALANAGISGSMAGTSLREVMLRAGQQGTALSEAMGKPVESFDDFIAGIKKMKKDGFDPMESGLDAVGKRAIPAFGIILDNIDSIDNIEDSLKNAV